MLRQSQLLIASKQFSATRSIATRALRQHPSNLYQRSQPSILASVPRFAPFSTSTHKKIMPPGPQVVDGGINDPAPVPKPSPIHGSYHWTFERGLSIALIPLTIVPFTSGSLNPYYGRNLCVWHGCPLTYRLPVSAEVHSQESSVLTMVAGLVLQTIFQLRSTLPFERPSTGY